MRIVALVSGGKDSCYNIMQCVAAGHTIVGLANIEPQNHSELDSYMYQSAGHEAVAILGEALGLPLFRKFTEGKACNQSKEYSPTDSDEVEDLFELLQDIKKEIEYDGVAVGAILSDYQRIRVENVCSRLGLISVAYLWRRNQMELLDEMLLCGVEAVLVKVAALGLEPSRDLGTSISAMRPQLLLQHDQYGLNVCGEGGEYETFTLDCPLYKSAITVDESETIIHSDDAIAPVGYLRFLKVHLESKDIDPVLENRLKDVPIKDPLAYIADIDEDEIELRRECSNEEGDIEKMEFLNCEHINNTLSHEMVNYEIEHAVSSGRTANGWMWIGGCSGCSIDPEIAMKLALNKLKNCLTDYGLTVQDVCSVTMYISDMSLYTKFNEIYTDFFKYEHPPARVCVQCPLSKFYPVLLDALAFHPIAPEVTYSPTSHGDYSPCSSSSNDEDSLGNKLNRVTMHVQGISHWAPANIGPYSQAVQIGDITRVAGQIGMVPGTLQIVEGGVRRQCRLSLRHVGRIVAAMDPNMQLRDVVQGVCYVTHPNYALAARQEWEKRTNNAIVDYLIVSDLPKGAMVEWHLWAHKHNNQFEYEETGQCVGNYLLSIRRRWNYENNVAAVVCYIEHPCNLTDEPLLHETLSEEIIAIALEYAISKLNQDYTGEISPVCNLRIYYPVSNHIDIALVHEVFLKHRDTYNIVYTIVPVYQLQNINTLLSICGIRYQ